MASGIDFVPVPYVRPDVEEYRGLIIAEISRQTGWDIVDCYDGGETESNPGDLTHFRAFRDFPAHFVFSLDGNDYWWSWSVHAHGYKTRKKIVGSGLKPDSRNLILFDNLEDDICGNAERMIHWLLNRNGIGSSEYSMYSIYSPNRQGRQQWCYHDEGDKRRVMFSTMVSESRDYALDTATLTVEVVYNEGAVPCPFNEKELSLTLNGEKNPRWQVSTLSSFFSSQEDQSFDLSNGIPDIRPAKVYQRLNKSLISPVSRSEKERNALHVARYEKIVLEYLDFELRPDTILYAPEILDVNSPACESFHEAWSEVMNSEGVIASAAVVRMEAAWERLKKSATRSADTYLPQHESRRLGKLYALADSESSSRSERESAWEKFVSNSHTAIPAWARDDRFAKVPEVGQTRSLRVSMIEEAFGSSVSLTQAYRKYGPSSLPAVTSAEGYRKSLASSHSGRQSLSAKTQRQLGTGGGSSSSSRWWSFRRNKG